VDQLGCGGGARGDGNAHCLVAEQQTRGGGDCEEGGTAGFDLGRGGSTLNEAARGEGLEMVRAD
jgi:hypothetical protein